MKAKFKIGTLIQYTENERTDAYGRVDSIVTNKDGYSYLIGGGTDRTEIQEDDVTAAFTEISTKSKRATSKGTKTKRQAKMPTQQATALEAEAH